MPKKWLAQARLGFKRSKLLLQAGQIKSLSSSFTVVSYELAAALTLKTLMSPWHCFPLAIQLSSKFHLDACSSWRQSLRAYWQSNQTALPAQQRISTGGWLNCTWFVNSLGQKHDSLPCSNSWLKILDFAIKTTTAFLSGWATQD